MNEFVNVMDNKKKIILIKVLSKKNSSPKKEFKKKWLQINQNQVFNHQSFHNLHVILPNHPLPPPPNLVLMFYDWFYHLLPLPPPPHHHHHQTWSWCSTSDSTTYCFYHHHHQNWLWCSITDSTTYCHYHHGYHHLEKEKFSWNVWGWKGLSYTQYRFTAISFCKNIRGSSLGLDTLLTLKLLCYKKL